MKRFIFFLLFIFLGSTGLHAQQDTIRASEAQRFIGKTVQLCDRIHNGHMDNISKNAPTILYTGDTYQTRTLALIFPQNVLRTFSYDPEKKMENHTFCVKGKIATYKGKPAIYIQSESQLNVEE